MEKSINKNILIVGGVILVVLFFVGGFFMGRNDGEERGEEKYRAVVEAIYPKPPKELRSLTGKILSAYGATLELEVNDPKDYLPHTDGSPRAKQIRLANTTPETAYTLVDYSKLDAKGSPAKTAKNFSDLEGGMTITVESAENVLDAKEFDVTKVTLVKY